MGKRLIIKGADFSANRIDFGPVPQEVEWSIGTISSTGVIGADNTGIHSNLLDVKEISVSFNITILDSNAFGSYGAAPVLVLYDNAGEFITRLVSWTTSQGVVSALKTSYPTMAKVRLAVGAYASDVTNVGTALSKFDYTVTGI